MTHNQRVAAALAQLLIKHPNMTVNECCRELTRQGLSVSKQLVAGLRKQTIKAMAATVKTPTVMLMREMSKSLGGERTSASSFIDISIRPPPALLLQDVALRAREDEAQSRAKKVERDAERGREQAERQAEREKQWAAEREAQASVPVDADPPPPPTETLQQSPVKPTPHRRGSAEDRALRRQYVNELLDADPGADPVAVIAKVRERFGVGLDWNYVYETCRVAREVAGLPQIPTIGPHTRVVDATESAAGITPEEDLQWLLRQLRDLMRAHGLASVEVVATETGANWQFTEKPREPRSARGELKF